MTDEPDSMQFTLTEGKEREALPENVVVGDFGKPRPANDAPKTEAKPPEPPARFITGDWVRYYSPEGILSIAKVEYIRADGPNGVLRLFTDRGVLHEGAVVEIRRESNDKPAA